MSGSRNTNGCYTCRIRKKKCDETHPVCKTCSSRGIPCHGYGAKPTWYKDARTQGHRIKEVREIRYAAELGHRLKRVPWMSSDGSPEVDVNETSLNNAYSVRNPPKYDLERLLDLFIEDEVGVRLDYDDGRRTRSQTAELPPHHAAYTSDIGEVTTMLSRPTSNDSSYSKSTSTFKTSSHALSSIWWHSAVLTTLPVHNNQEAILLNTYLTDVINLQFGFYSRSKASGDRKWLTDLLIRSKPVYSSAISITECYHTLLREGTTDGDALISQQLRHFHITSLKEVQKLVDELNSLHGAELFTAGFATLASMNQLLSLELFRTLQGHWEMHHEGERKLLAMIDRQPFSKTGAPSQSTLQLPIPSSITSILLNPSSINSTSFSALTFFLTVFISEDILSRTSFPIPISNATEFYYQHLLTTSPPLIDLSHVIGCQNSSMIALLKISELRDWKSAGTLDISALAYKTAHLDLKLRTDIVHLSNQISAFVTKTMELEIDILLVTRLYTRAALIFLHIILSGAFPSIPTVQAAVNEAITDFEELPSRLLIRLSLPLCMVGCMADGANIGRVKEVIRQASLRGNELGTIWKGYKVMQECWRLRRMGEEGEVHWGTGMASLNLRILLI